MADVKPPCNNPGCPSSSSKNHPRWAIKLRVIKAVWTILIWNPCLRMYGLNFERDVTIYFNVWYVHANIYIYMYSSIYIYMCVFKYIYIYIYTYCRIIKVILQHRIWHTNKNRQQRYISNPNDLGTMPRAADWQVKEPKKIQAKLWKRKTQNITSSKTQNIPKCFSWPIFCISAMIFLVKSKSLHKCESFPPLSPAHPMTLRDQLRHVGNGKMSSPVKNSSTSPKIEGTVNPTKKTERKNVLKPFDVCSWKTSLWFLREFCDALPTHSVIDWQKKTRFDQCPQSYQARWWSAKWTVCLFLRPNRSKFWRFLLFVVVKKTLSTSPGQNEGHNTIGF